MKPLNYSELIKGSHYRLPEWPKGRSIVSGIDGLRLYQDGKYVGYIGSLSFEEQKRQFVPY